MKTSCKRCSGGVIVYLRNDYVCSDNLFFTNVDDIICIKLNGEQFSLNSDLYVCLCCVVPENSNRQTLIETHTFDRLLEVITNLDANDTNELNFVLCGDLNAHTSDLPDYVAFDTFLENVLPEDYINDIISTGCSQDKGRINNNGLMLLDLCKQTGMRIINGRFDKDVIGRYTHVCRRVLA